MKRILTLLITLIVPFSLLANSQRLYDASSDEYILASDLALISGTVGPSTSVPVTAQEILIALERINPAGLPEYFKDQYYDLKDKLQPSDAPIKLNIPIRISPQIFLIGVADERDDFFIPYRDEKPLAGFGLRLESMNNIYMETEIPLMNAPSGTEVPLTSFDFLIGGNTDIYGMMPTIARASVGSENLSLIIGRTRHSMGSGIMGNLLVGDNFSYQELLELKFISNYLTYNIAVTHFDTEVTDTDGTEYVAKAHFDGYQQIRVVHRAEANLFNKARVVCNLGTLFYTSSAFDFRWIIPFNILHNTYDYHDNPLIEEQNYDEANNIISVELDFPFARRFNLSIHWVMDQLMLGNEAEKEYKAHTAQGGLASLSYAQPIDKGILKLYVEGIYTTPYLYRNAKYNSDEGNTINYNYDFLLGYFRMTKAGGYDESFNMSTMQDELEYTGFTPDTIAVQTGIIYKNYEHRFTSNTILRYQVQGAMADDHIIYPKYNPDDTGSSDAGITPSSDAVHTISLTQLGSWNITRMVSLYGGFYLGWSFGNVQAFSPQMYLGVTLNFL